MDSDLAGQTAGKRALSNWSFVETSDRRSDLDLRDGHEHTLPCVFLQNGCMSPITSIPSIHHSTAAPDEDEEPELGRRRRGERRRGRRRREGPEAKGEGHPAEGEGLLEHSRRSHRGRRLGGMVHKAARLSWVGIFTMGYL